MKIINIGCMDKSSFPDMFASKGVHLGTEAHTIMEVAKETHLSPSITLASAVTRSLTVLESVQGQVCDGRKEFNTNLGISGTG
jgi:hypothetical protein